MEKNCNKQVGSASPSSFTNDLFGSMESAPPPSSTGIFSSIFPPPSKVMGSNISTSELMESIQRQSAESQVSKEGTPEDFDKNKEGASHYALNKERTVFQEKPEPCPLSSSLYYGGLEDMYVQSSNGQSYSGFKKDGKEDDQYGNNSHIASRGNWWQGSLYY